MGLAMALDGNANAQRIFSRLRVNATHRIRDVPQLHQEA
jgi:hypothetical protein